MKTLTNATNNQTLRVQATMAIGHGTIAFWVALILFAGLPRVIGVFFLPNAFGDAYSYIQEIEVLRAKIVRGGFSVTDLYGFWLPLYQFISATLSAIFGHPFYVARLVSALCGAGVCLFVFQIGLRLTESRKLSLLAFALISLSPLHILYSSSAMTDAPHAFLAIASLRFALGKRWKTAATFAAAAGFMRVESWMLIALLAALQFIIQRKVSLAALGVMMVAPLLWFYICWKATGDPLAYFEVRNRYIVEYIEAVPATATFSLKRLLVDAARLLTSTTLGVLTGCFAAAWIVIKRTMRQGIGMTLPSFFAVIATLTFFFSYLGFLLLSYFRGDQPVIWTRYGLLFFALGLPALAWAFGTVIAERPQYKKALSVALLVIFTLQAIFQAGEVASVISDEFSRKEIAAYISDVHRSAPHVRIFCEDGSVRILSGFPSEKFLDSSDLPTDRAAFVNRLRQDRVEYLITTSSEVSTLTRLFPELKQGTGNDIFQPVMRAESKYSSLKIWVYQIR